MHPTFAKFRRPGAWLLAWLGPLAIIGATLITSTSQAQEKPVANDVAAERARFVEKIKEINRWGPEARIVNDLTAELDKSIADGSGLVAYLGPGLTKDHQPYRLSWTNKAFAFAKLTPEEAAKEDIKEMDMTVKHPSATPPPAPPPPPAAKTPATTTVAPLAHEYMISDVMLGDPPGTIRYGQPFSVKARIQRSSDSKPGEQVFLLVEAGTTLATEEIDPPAPGRETEIQITASPADSTWKSSKWLVGRTDAKLRVYIVKFLADATGRWMGNRKVSNMIEAPVQVVP
jgi:hypothetical protein